MKITLDISQAIYGTGVSNYTIELVTHLLEINKSDEYCLFGASFRRRSEFPKLFRSPFSNFKLQTFPIPPTVLSLFWNTFHTLPIEKLVGKTDIYHSSDWAQSPSKARRVTTIHDLSPFMYPQEMSNGGIRDIAKTHEARMKWVVRECDRIICVSQNTANDLVKIFPSIEQGRVVVIPEALPSRSMIVSSIQDTELAKSKYTRSDYIVTIGTLQPRKNIVRLVNMFLELRKKYNLPEKLVVIGGKGWGKSPISKDKSVIYTGYISDFEKIALLRGARVFVYPSLYEGFGIPVLEAFYHQVPVVTSNTSSLPEVAGNAAILVNPKSEESIAQGISEAIKKREKLISLGTKQLTKFSWQKAAVLTLNTYQSLFP